MSVALPCTRIGLKNSRQPLDQSNSHLKLNQWKLLIHHLLSNSHSWAFINDNNSLLVCHVHDFISVWVMTGSETIGAQPLDKVEVFGNDSIVHSFTTNLQKTLTSQEGMMNIITRIQSNNNVYPKMSIFWCSIVPPSWQIKYRAIFNGVSKVSQVWFMNKGVSF